MWSSITDQVRDTTAGMQLSNEAVRLLIEKYNLSRSNVKVALSEEAQEAMEAIAPELADTVDQTVLHASAATLAAFLNAVHNGPAFDAQHQMTMSQIANHPDFQGFGGEHSDIELESATDLLVTNSAYL